MSKPAATQPHKSGEEKVTQPKLAQSVIVKSKEQQMHADYDYYRRNMKDPSVREKFITNQLQLISSSEDEDDDDV